MCACMRACECLSVYGKKSLGNENCDGLGKHISGKYYNSWFRIRTSNLHLSQLQLYPLDMFYQNITILFALHVQKDSRDECLLNGTNVCNTI